MSLTDLILGEMLSRRSKLEEELASLDILESHLKIILSSIKPTESSRRERWIIIDHLRSVVRSIPNLQDFAQKLELIHGAKVPILKFKIIPYTIHCDVSLNNIDGRRKSNFLLWICGIDQRCRDLPLLVKEWAKAQDLNNPQDRTLNSYAICLMVIFYLQSCSPPILPPLNHIYHKDTIHAVSETRFVDVRWIEQRCRASIDSFKVQQNRGENRSTLAELLISFFKMYLDLAASASTCVLCPSTARWGLKYSKPELTKAGHPFIIEDPFDSTSNPARSVVSFTMSRIADSFARAYATLSSSSLLSERNLIARMFTRQSIEGIRSGGTFSGPNHYASSSRSSVLRDLRPY